MQISTRILYIYGKNTYIFGWILTWEIKLISVQVWIKFYGMGYRLVTDESHIWVKDQTLLYMGLRCEWVIDESLLEKKSNQVGSLTTLLWHVTSRFFALLIGEIIHFSQHSFAGWEVCKSGNTNNKKRALNTSQGRHPKSTPISQSGRRVGLSVYHSWVIRTSPISSIWVEFFFPKWTAFMTISFTTYERYLICRRAWAKLPSSTLCGKFWVLSIKKKKNE